MLTAREQLQYNRMLVFCGKHHQCLKTYHLRYLAEPHQGHATNSAVSWDIIRLGIFGGFFSSAGGIIRNVIGFLAMCAYAQRVQPHIEARLLALQT